MKVAAKSSIGVNPLQDKKNKGAEFIELHLFENDVQGKQEVEESFKTLVKTDTYVVVAHTPIDRRFSLESLNTEYGYNIIDNVCDLAERLAEYQGEAVHVVIHCELGLDQFEMWGYYSAISEKISKLLIKYPNIIINVENLAMVCFDKGAFFFTNCFAYNNIKLVKKLRHDLNTSRIGTVLDTCHILMSKVHVDLIDEKGLFTPFSIHKILEESKTCVNIIHLANSKGLGLFENHGVGFDTEEDYELLQDIVSSIKSINFEGILTLEVQEQDYLDSKVFPKLFLQVNQLL